jgi:hypothetical protein
LGGRGDGKSGADVETVDQMQGFTAKADVEVLDDVSAAASMYHINVQIDEVENGGQEEYDEEEEDG